MTLNTLLQEGYKIIFEGYDHMSTWVVLEKSGEQFYYSLITESLEKIEIPKELKWDEYGNLLEECK
jgi:predicted deacetylase